MAETIVQYHSDNGRARPAINVKVYGLVWPQPAMRELAARVGDGPAEQWADRANEELTEDFWRDASAKAVALGLADKEVYAEGRSGGWLVFDRNDDPADMQPTESGLTDDPSDPDLLHCDYCKVVETAADLTPEWNGETGNHTICEERKRWLAAYQTMAEWCTEQVRTAPERIAERAVELERGEHAADVMVWPDGYKDGEPNGGGVTEERPVIGRCLWCGERLVDGRIESGYTGEGPDYMTPGGDFGCGDSPDTSEDGTGGHTPAIAFTADGHVLRMQPKHYAGFEVIAHPADDGAGSPSGDPNVLAVLLQMRRALAPAIVAAVEGK